MEPKDHKYLWISKATYLGIGKGRVWQSELMRMSKWNDNDIDSDIDCDSGRSSI